MKTQIIKEPGMVNKLITIMDDSYQKNLFILSNDLLNIRSTQCIESLRKLLLNPLIFRSLSVIEHLLLPCVVGSESKCSIDFRIKQCSKHVVGIKDYIESGNLEDDLYNHEYDDEYIIDKIDVISGKCIDLCTRVIDYYNIFEDYKSILIDCNQLLNKLEGCGKSNIINSVTNRDIELIVMYNIMLNNICNNCIEVDKIIKSIYQMVIREGY